MNTLKTLDDHGILFDFARDDVGRFYVSSEGKTLASFALTGTAAGWAAFDVEVLEPAFEPRALHFISTFCGHVNAGEVRVD